jgi:hypothetical protein
MSHVKTQNCNAAEAGALASDAPPSKEQPRPGMAGVKSIAANNTPRENVRQVRKHAVYDLRYSEDFEWKGKAENVACRQNGLESARTGVQLGVCSRPDVKRLEIDVSEKSASV